MTFLSLPLWEGAFLNSAKLSAREGVLIEGNSKTGKVAVEASDGAWVRFLDWWERCYRFTLEWITANPILFGVMALVFTVWRWQAHLTKTELGRQKIEYEQARKAARGQRSPQKGRGG